MLNAITNFAKEHGAIELPETKIEQFQPFPTSELPEPLRGFVESGAAAIGCDTSFVALPALVAVAAAIGNTRRIRLKSSWTAPPNLWGVIVGESGSSKTPALKLVLRVIEKRQCRAFQQLIEVLQDYENASAIYERDYAAWKRSKSTSPPPEKPSVPLVERLIVSDVTVEALAPMLQDNQRGLLLARDELAGWFGSFDKYSGGNGIADCANWLPMHSGESLTVDRKSGTPRTIHVKNASLSLIGGIQPGILQRALGTQNWKNGLAARLLFVYPPRKTKRWTEDDIDPAVEARIESLFDALYALQPEINDEGEYRPRVIGQTTDAKKAWVCYYNAHAEEQNGLTGDLSAAWSKLEEGAARLALVIHFARYAAADPELRDPDLVDAESMKAGIRLATWFKNEYRRVYELLSESDEAGEIRQLFEWIERKGGEVTAREVQQGHRDIASAEAAEAAINKLEQAGYGRWVDRETKKKGGRPTRVFQLLTPPTENPIL